jgi:hypothetical protein
MISIHDQGVYQLLGRERVWRQVRDVRLEVP